MTARRRLVAASVFVCAAVLAACSDDDDPGAGPSEQTTSPTAASSSASTPSGTTSEPTDATDPTDPTNSTAPGGPVVELRDFTIQAPEGWSIDNQTKDFQVVFKDDASNGGLIFVDNPTAFPGEDVESLAKSALQRARALGHGGERVENRTVGGHEGYVIVGSTKAYENFYEWGTLVGDNQVSVGFEWVIKPENADQTIESVLASIQFR